MFKRSPTGRETVLHNFCAQRGCPDGHELWSGVIRDAKGNLYGTTYFGGTNGFGVVFQVTP